MISSLVSSSCLPVGRSARSTVGSFTSARAMAVLGAATPMVTDPAPNHSNRMVIDEPATATAVALHAAVAPHAAVALQPA